MSELSDHDLLVQINAQLQMFIEQTAKNDIRNSEEHGIFKKAYEAVHRRVDRLQLSGILAVITMTLTFVGVALKMILT